MNDHYSILGVGRQASTAEIANAYRQLLIRERQDKGEQAEFGLYSLAYRTLTNPGKRIDYDRFLDELSGKYVIKEPQTPSEAEKCYLAGLTCMEQKNFQDAVDYLYRAVQLEPETSHFCSQLGLALGMFKDRLAEAERYCKKAIGFDPDNPDFRFNLGFLYQRHNLVDAAQTAFDLANEAIRSRQVRLLKENEPLITPWEQEGHDLLDELSRLETMVNGVERQPEGSSQDRTATAEAPAAEPGERSTPPPAGLQPVSFPEAPEELVTESDLLRQLDDLESQVSKSELAGVLAATADQADAPMEPFLDDDLLKELDLLEAQVRGVEDFHSAEFEKFPEQGGAGPETMEAPAVSDIPVPQAPPLSETPAVPEPAALENEAGENLEPVPESQVVGAAGETREAKEPAAAADKGYVPVETMYEEALAGVAAPPPEPPSQMGPAPVGASEAPAFQPLQKAELPEASAQAAPDAVPGAWAEAAGISIRETPAPAVKEPADGPALPPPAQAGTAAGESEEANDRQLPRGAAADKMRMLEDLEREMQGELDLLRREKERLQAAG